MIYKLDILDPTKTPVPWLSKVEALAKPRTFEFKPGLNVLWGRNGSGKTSLTRLLARLFHCEQGNHPNITKESLSDLVGGRVMDDLDIKERPRKPPEEAAKKARADVKKRKESEK